MQIEKFTYSSPIPGVGTKHFVLSTSSFTYLIKSVPHPLHRGIAPSFFFVQPLQKAHFKSLLYLELTFYPPIFPNFFRHSFPFALIRIFNMSPACIHSSLLFMNYYFVQNLGISQGLRRQMQCSASFITSLRRRRNLNLCLLLYRPAHYASCNLEHQLHIHTFGKENV